MKSIALALMLSAPQIFAQEATIASYEESFNPLEDLAQAFTADKDFHGKVLDICVGGQCMVLDLTGGMEKGGMPETIAKPTWASDIATVVKSATGGVSGAASVKVSVTHTNKDGSSTKVDVEVKVEGKK
jgi:hypothetical protein